MNIKADASALRISVIREGCSVDYSSSVKVFLRRTAPVISPVHNRTNGSASATVPEPACLVMASLTPS